MTRRLTVLMAILVGLLPLVAVFSIQAATTNPTLPGVAPTAAATVANPDTKPGIAPTIAATVANPDTKPGVAPTAASLPIVFPTSPATSTPNGTPTGTVAATGTATGTPTSSATPTGTATATATTPACATGTATGTAAASATPCATATATAVPISLSCPANTPSGDTTLLAPSGAKGELTKLRTATSRVYDVGNGLLKQVITEGTINYADAKGALQPIDNTLVPATASGYAEQNKANAYTLALPTDLSANPVKLTKGTASVSFSLVGACGNGTPCGTTQTYANALPGVTLAYTAGNDGTEETLTLASSSAPHTFTYTLQLSAGLNAKANSHGGIDFVDTEGKVQLTLTPPHLSDSAKPKPAQSSAATLTLGQSAGSTTVTLNADGAWLSDPARVYPVVIDPSWGPAIDTRDCFMSSAEAPYALCDFNNGYSNFFVGNYPQGPGFTARGLAQFDVSQVPTNAQIKDAEVDLYLIGNSNQVPAPVSVYGVTTAWVNVANSTSWNYPWQTPGGDFLPTVFATQTVGTTSQYYAWHPTQLVRGWLNGSITNDGMLFAMGSGEMTEFEFGANSTGNLTGNYPKLTITYPNLDSEIGVQGYYVLAGSTIDDHLAAAVNPVSGNFLLQANDLNIAGTGLNLGVSRYYNSLMDARGSMGNRWTTNTGADVRLIGYTQNNNVALVGASGYQALFTNNQNGTFTAPAGIYADLTFDGATFTLVYHANRLRYHFNTVGVLLTISDQKNNTITYGYTSGVMTSITDTQGRVVNFGYTNGLITTMTDTAGSRTWTYNYTGNNLTSVYDPVNGSSHPTIFGYDSSNNLTQITTPKGNVTTIHYPTPGTYSVVDSFTRVNPGYSNVVTSFAYNTGNTVITDANGHASTVTFDTTTDLVSQVKDALNHSTYYAYTSKYKLKTVTDALSHTTTYCYAADCSGDGDGEHVLQVKIPTGATTSYAYDDSNVPFYVTKVTDAQNRTVTYTYDTNGNRKTATNDLASENQVQYFYNTNGTIEHVVDARGKQTTFVYTYSGGVLTTLVVTPPLNVAKTTTTFDGVGRTWKVLDGKSQLTTFTHDDLDRTTNILFNDTTTVAYTIDGDGDLQSRTDGTGTTSFTYDAINRMLTKVLPAGAGGQTLTHTYDTLGNLLTYTDLGGTVTYGYDTVNRLVALAEPGGSCSGTVSKCTTFTYDDANNHLTTVYPNGVGITLMYDASNRLTDIKGTIGTSTLTRFSYTYLNGTTDTALRQTMSENDAQAVTTTAYQYDAANRLTNAVTTATSGNPASYQYAYDGNGNRTSSTAGGASTSATFNDANEMLTWVPGQSVTFGYDLDGNETSSTDGLAFAYNAKNQTTSVTGRFGTTLSMGYSDAGQGERTSAGNSTYVNSGLGVASEKIGSATTYYTRTPGGHLVSQRTPSATYYYLFDGLGSVVALTDASTNMVARYGYDPYGQTVVKTGEGIKDQNPWRYTGAYLDATGLYKMGARYYDPARGRFTQLDPLGGGYVYANDNPVKFADPSGLSTVTDPNTQNTVTDNGTGNTIEFRGDSHANNVTVNGNGDTVTIDGYENQVTVNGNGDKVNVQGSGNTIVDDANGNRVDIQDDGKNLEITRNGENPNLGAYVKIGAGIVLVVLGTNQVIVAAGVSIALGGVIELAGG